jgi:hypothetical protein
MLVPGDNAAGGLMPENVWREIIIGVFWSSLAMAAVVLMG